MSWWFPSCTKCSKSCVQDGAGYRCNPCSSTSFRFKYAHVSRVLFFCHFFCASKEIFCNAIERYKLSFIALDGTDESEMICFGEIGCQIIGKPVQQLLRMTTPANPVPADIARIISQTFTFTISLTQQSYYRHEKTYQVTSVITSHGQHDAPHVAPPNGNGAQPSGDAGNQEVAEIADADETTLSPVAVVDIDLLSVLTDTVSCLLPPVLYIFHDLCTSIWNFY